MYYYHSLKQGRWLCLFQGSSQYTLKPNVTIFAWFLSVVLTTTCPQSSYNLKSSQQFLVSILHSVTEKKKVKHTLSHFATGHLDPEIQPYSKRSGKSNLAIFSVTFEPLANQLPLTTTIQNIFEYWLPTSVSPAVTSNEVGRVDLLLLLSRWLFGITFVINGLPKCHGWCYLFEIRVSSIVYKVSGLYATFKSYNHC